MRCTTDWKRRLTVLTEPTSGFVGMLGLAMRAGKVIAGTEMVCVALPKKGKVKLVILSDEASEGTRKKISTKCEFYGVSALTVRIDTAELGRLIGKTYGPACVGITDDGFANELAKRLSPHN